jgi:RNA polymerase sigma factor (sigma-70 family)
VYLPLEKRQHTDAKLIAMIRQPGAGRKEALRFIFLSWQNIAKAILLKTGAHITEVENAIMEAIIVLDNHIRNSKYEKKSNLKNFFIGICKGRLYSNKRGTRRIEWTDDPLKIDGIEMQEPETLMLEKEEKTLIRNMLNMLDPKCREVLKLYQLSYPNKEIAEEVGLGNANNARQWVSICKKRLKELVIKNPLFTNYFNY